MYFPRISSLWCEYDFHDAVSELEWYFAITVMDEDMDEERLNVQPTVED